MSSIHRLLLVHLCGVRHCAKQSKCMWAQRSLFSLPLDTLAERTDSSRGGFVFDATGDGTADDMFVANYNQANEIFVRDGAGGLSLVINAH